MNRYRLGRSKRKFSKVNVKLIVTCLKSTRLMMDMISPEVKNQGNRSK